MLISLMLAVENAAEAAAWYKRALGAEELWSMGSVMALTIDGAPFLLHEPTDGFSAPAGAVTARVEVFTDDPDTLIASAIAAGAKGSLEEIRNYEAPWGEHRQGGFWDPFGHRWLVGDKTPLQRWSNAVPDKA
ncbi:MAG: VOC family protein [Pseudomonadota bacterium]